MPNPDLRRALELEHAAAKEEALERFRSQQGLAEAAFRTLVFANGGAIVALFTLIGSNASIARTADSPVLWGAFASFAAGLAVTVAALICGYFMQVNYANATVSQMWNKSLEIAGQRAQNDPDREIARGSKWELAAIILTVAGLAAFIGGSALCFFAFV